MITSDMLISEILEIDPKLAAVFFENGMFCVGCASAAQESVKDACATHGINADELVKKLNEHLSSN